MTSSSSDPTDRQQSDVPGREASSRGGDPSRGRRAKRAAGAEAGGGSSASDAGETANDDEASTPSSAPGERKPVPFTQILGRITLVALAVLFGVFAVVNSQPVTFSWVFGATEVRPNPSGDSDVGGVPLIILLVGSFVIGAAVGMLLEWLILRGRRRRDDAS